MKMLLCFGLAIAGLSAAPLAHAQEAPSDAPITAQPNAPQPGLAPAPPGSVPAPPNVTEEVVNTPVEPSQGQWVFTNQYGWVWMPYGQTYTYVPGTGDPYAYVFNQGWGWRWVVAPWVFGWGPQPYWGSYGYNHFTWYASPWFHPRVWGSWHAWSGGWRYHGYGNPGARYRGWNNRAVSHPWGHGGGGHYRGPVNHGGNRGAVNRGGNRGFGGPHPAVRVGGTYQGEGGHRGGHGGNRVAPQGGRGGAVRGGGHGAVHSAGPVGGHRR